MTVVKFLIAVWVIERGCEEVSRFVGDHTKDRYIIAKDKNGKFTHFIILHFTKHRPMKVNRITKF